MIWCVNCTIHWFLYLNYFLHISNFSGVVYSKSMDISLDKFIIISAILLNSFDGKNNSLIPIYLCNMYMTYKQLMCQFSSVTQLCPTLCDPMNRSTPGLPVHHQLPESTQTQVPWVSNTIQSSHPPSSLSPPALNLSQHQGLFQWVSSSHQVSKVLEFQLQHQSFQRTPRTDLLYDVLVGSPSIQWTLKSLLQHHSSKASIFWCSAFFKVQLSHL